MRLSGVRPFLAIAPLLCTAFLFKGCSREPVWKQDLKALLDGTNRELEAVIQGISPDSTPDAVLTALTRLDKFGDQIINNLESFLKKYPDIIGERVKIWLYLRSELNQLGNNLKAILTYGNFWQKKLGKRKDFDELTRSILKKGKQVEILLRKAGND